MGIASAAQVSAALQASKRASEVRALEQQYIMARRLHSAVVYFESSIAASPAFWWEQIAGLIAVPPYQLNRQWEPALLTHEAATRLLGRFAAHVGRAWSPPWTDDSFPLTKAELHAGMVSIGAGEATLPTTSNATALLCELRQAVAIALIQRDASNTSVHAAQVYSSDDVAPMSFVQPILFDSFQRAAGAVGSPEVGAGVWAADGFEIFHGAAYPTWTKDAVQSDMTTDRWLLINASVPSEAAVLSVQMALFESSEQPVASSDIGLVFARRNADSFGFFGFRHSRSGDGSIECVLRHPTTGQLTARQMPPEVWPLQSLSTAHLQLHFEPTGHHTASVNGISVFDFVAKLDGELGLLKKPGHLFGKFGYLQLTPSV